MYDVNDNLGVVLLTRLRVGFSHLRRTNAIETTEHYLLYCPNFYLHRNALFYNLHCKGINLLPYKYCHLTRILLYGDRKFNIELNRIILNSVIRFLLTYKRFEGSPYL